MVKFHCPTSSLEFAISIVAVSCRMLGAHSRLRPLPLSSVGLCVSCNNNNDNNNINEICNVCCSLSLQDVGCP